ncbi:TPA: peptidase [Escherichia coli]|nr:peptidase [Escherichia coli]HAJ2033381.1 peptidase [Escherichia coli]HAJ2038283.1 peptidase [Escherichia coli]HAJ2357975.1 peptidase [Escherichia coli]HAJ2424279.1 peptidase [Escherichia coli]
MGETVGQSFRLCVVNTVRHNYGFHSTNYRRR